MCCPPDNDNVIPHDSHDRAAPVLGEVFAERSQAGSRVSLEHPNGSFGGDGVSPDDETLEKVVAGLVEGECLVGFGDPSFPNWCVPPELRVARENLAREIVRLWRANPENWEFITFAIRDERTRAT